MPAYLSSARNPRIRGLDILAVGDVFSQALPHISVAPAPAVGEEVQVAVALVGAVAGVDDGQSLVFGVDDPLALAHVGATGAAGDRGELGVSEERRVVGGTGAVVAAILGSESEDVDDWSRAAVVTRLIRSMRLLGLGYRGLTSRQSVALDKLEPEGWP
jgi:hypothetical protein